MMGLPMYGKLYLVFYLMALSSPTELTNNSDSLLLNTANLTDHCQQYDWVNNLAVTMSYEHNYTKGVYVCRQFANALLKRLNECGCSARLATGWFGYKGTSRGWHRWVQTPYFNIEATPDAAGIISDSEMYHASYYSPMNFSYE